MIYFHSEGLKTNMFTMQLKQILSNYLAYAHISKKRCFYLGNLNLNSKVPLNKITDPSKTQKKITKKI